MKKIIAGVIALVIILGGGGVAAASNSAIPGDFLFPVDLQIEKLRIQFSSDDKKENLKFRFTEERVSEVRDLAERKGMAALVTDLSGANITELEAKIYTNEILVKIEANDRKYGFVTSVKSDNSLIEEIAEKYSLTKEKVTSLIVFNREDRASRAEDKDFLNRTSGAVFSSDENNDVSRALTDLNKFLIENADPAKTEQIQKKLNELLVLLGDDANINIERKDGEIRIEFNDSNDDSMGSGKDDDSDNDSNDDNSHSSDVSNSSDVRESDNEVFCRGEWRDPSKCNDFTNSSDDTTDDTSNDSGGSDDGSNHDVNDDKDGNNSGSGNRGGGDN